MFDKVIAKLEDASAQFRVIEHEPEGQSDKICSIRGNTLHQGAKAMLVRVAISKKKSRYVLAVVPADLRVNMQTIQNHFASKSVRMASLERVQELTGCEIGAVPPFSFNPDVALVIDPKLIDDNDEIAFNAGRLDRSVIMDAKDYKKVVENDGAIFLENSGVKA